MSQLNIANRVRTAINSRLSNVTNGFNPCFAAAAAAYSTTPFAIDFSQPSKNFFQGYFDIAVLYGIEGALPAITTYHIDTPDNPGIQMTRFSGTVGFGVGLHLISLDGDQWNGFEIRKDAAHDAIFQTFNDPVAGPTYTANLVTWNRRLVMQAERPAYNEEDHVWLQTIRFNLRFTLMQP